MSDPVTQGIGAPEPRHGARRLAEGRGRYLDDITLPGLLHLAFVRSPMAHARLLSADVDDARAAPGVVAVLTGADLAAVCKPYDTSLPVVPGHASPPQPPLVIDEACYQGEPAVAVIATSRALAEDAAEMVWLDWEDLPAAATVAEAEAGVAVHSAMASNLALDHRFGAEDVAEAFAGAAHVVEADFDFGRQTGVTLEPRGLIADWDPRSETLSVHISHQAPWQMREVFARQLDLPSRAVRVVAPDVGGAFGLKLHAYAEDIATAAASRLLGRPVKYVADRLEAFGSDAHSREARATCRMAITAEGRILGIDAEVRAGFGAYAMHPRGSMGEAMQAAQMIGAPYQVPAFRARVRGWRQNKVPSGAYRGVGQPLACAITEEMMDLGARAAGLDPAAFRRLNHRAEAPAPHPAGLAIRELSLDACMDRLLGLMSYDTLRAEQDRLRGQGRLRGIGLATFVELTGVGPRLYGPLGVPVSAHEGVRLVLDPDGTVSCHTSVTDQGQGTLTGLAQVVAAEFGIAPGAVQVISGDTGQMPYGGGAWASRGMALGGEAARRGAARLGANLLAIAASVLQCDPATLRFEQGEVTGPAGPTGLDLGRIGAMAHYRPYEVPLDSLPPLTVEESFAIADAPYLVSNGLHAAHVEVDADTGEVTVLGYWVVDDCGRVVNPLLVDEQLRGGIVQGLGAALYEECVYSEDGQLTNGTLADYLVPMAGEMPDIHVAHVSTPARETGLGAKGVGEAGTVGAPAAIRSAVNDALAALGVRVAAQPFTPARVLSALMAAGH